MKHLKLALLLSVITAFAIACASTNTTPQTANTNAANAANANGANGANGAPTTPAAPDNELAAARATYNATCVRCHRETGEGGEIDMGDGGTLKVPSFKSGHGLNHTDAEFARQIAKGGDGMPSFEKRLTPEQIGGLVRFIRQELQTGLLKDGTPNSTH